MNLTELKKAVADSTGLTQVEADKALKATFEAMTAALKGGDSVAVPGFGSFSISERAARTGRNPKTGEEIKIAAAKVVKFKVGKGLKDAVNC
ncbi:HU family DNA-binding protein [Magnetofaba australis]|uniref:Putative nucleoid protein Hbs n=1 Tax=Magnetofaba australis IT-1 TaxID=1434232 RepID=A0A1Y2K9S0_9PROT|nr:HU family DNA-binding protein [Magnetofaba australis]OSM07363.1 putative nucleoid protein Hbs [Magnetofaba australis IT-1]